MGLVVRCEWCGAENYKPHPITGSNVVLTVAHIDHDIRNNGWENLAALCQRCHLAHDRQQHLSTQKRNRERLKREAEQARLKTEPLLPGIEEQR